MAAPTSSRASATGDASERRRIAVVTGASSGIGRATAEALAAHGWQVALVARRSDRLEELAARIEQVHPGAAAVVPADLFLQAEVRRVAGELLRRFDRIDGLVHAAGAWFQRREETTEGIERTWALNVLAPVLLSEVLRPSLRAASPAHLVMIASAAHLGHHLELDDLELKRRYGGYTAYGRSKLALILLTHCLAERYRPDGIAVNALHPGFIRSEFGWNNGGLLRAVIRSLEFLAGRSPRYGARTPVRLLTDPALAGVTGSYFARDRPTRSSPASYDRATERALWARVAGQIGVDGSGSSA